MKPMAHSPAYPVRQALHEFLSLNGFSLDEYNERTYWIDLAGWKIRLPNPAARRRMVPLHDLHHIATGYGTDLAGEGEIGAWELRAGCTTPMLWFLNVGAAMLGLLVAPRRTARAFATGRGTTTLYRLGVKQQDALELTVGDLRHQLGIPPQGLITT